MRQRTFQLFMLLTGTCVLLLLTTTSTLSAAAWPRQQASPPDSAPLDQAALEHFWHEMYPAAESIGIAADTNVYTHTLLAKAAPDECFNGIGVPVAITQTLPDCGGGQPKVNEAYVWGMTDYEDTIWFGTAPNVHCLVMGGFLGSTTPIQTNSYACEFGEGPYAPPLPDIIGDWRPPSLYYYDNQSVALTEITPNGQTGYPFDPRFISNTLGIRSAATFGDYVFFAGPAFTPTSSINIFLYDAATKTYRGSANIPGYGNIRKWLEVDGVLYTAVGKGLDGAVLRYTGDPAHATPANRFTFEEVGTLDADGAELALHDDRLFVNTWPSGFMSGDIAGLWMSPVIPVGGLTTADAGNWEQVFSYDEYEPDPVVAKTYGGGALHSYQGDLYWGTMHVPFLATVAHLAVYEAAYISASVPIEVAAVNAMLGSQRAVTLFKGRDFGTLDEEIEVAYGMPELPAFDPDTLTWFLTDTLIGPPLYGFSGFNNLFNNYTWSMAEYDEQLFVGTMDWSYLIGDIFETILDVIPLPLDLEISLPDAVVGADLYRFYDVESPALPVSLNGVGNYSSYGVRNQVGREDGLYLGMANPMNLLTDLTDNKPEGGWELIRVTRHLIPLTVNLGGNGSGSVTSAPGGIECGASCTAEYDYGSSITLTPTADVGSTFTGWNSFCFGVGNCTVQLLTASALTANFTLDTHTLSVALAGDGSGSVISDPAGINCGTACDKNYDYGTTVTLTPTAAAGSLFTGWEGACSGTDPCEVTITENAHVTATFANNRFPLVVNIIGSGSGFVSSLPVGMACSQPSCSANFDNGTDVALSAIAFSGSSFGEWSGACSGSDACQVTIGPGTTIVTATFDQNPQQTNLIVDGKFSIGATLHFTATLNINPITECTWDFGDGQTEACNLDVAASGVGAVHDIDIYATHTYTQAGVYIVTVTASNESGTIVLAQQVNIQTPTAEVPTQQPIGPSELYFPFLNRD